jgi:hypothetical protein
MDERSQSIFDKIVKREVRTLTEDDKAFLRARRSYLSVKDLEKFDSILNPEKAIGSKVIRKPRQTK